ncbi:3897_t:CDS:2 [Diversispora eburnea]|uniref:3897_t:CDS:1 n=1 Tax=Diversispora eburnea TaxID=1213867 RepID=A0A9N9C599_9GLOM|nr:3897_t:CDS:2 [Diversispora eburnea]
MTDDFDSFEENQDNPTAENQDNTFSIIDIINREESFYNSSTGNLIVHLQDVYSIIDDNVESRTSKNV